MSYSNPCIRCGQERVLQRTWTESISTYAGLKEIEYSENSCPDPECQKIVDKQLAAQKAKRASYINKNINKKRK